MAKKKQRKSCRAPVKTGYTALDEMLADPVKPMPLATRQAYALRLYSAIDDVSQADTPATASWNLLGDVTNLMQTFVLRGVCEDNDHLVEDAINALADAGRAYLDSGKLRLEGSALEAVRAIVADFLALIEIVPHRSMVQCHRATAGRIQNYLDNRPEDIEIIALER